MARADARIAALRARMPAPLVADLAHADAALPREALQRAGLTLDSC
jgi:hypothetical protein